MRGYQGSASGSLVIAKAAQTISFAGPANQVFSTVPITLSATASSGLTVSFSVVSGPASVSGTSLTLSGAGTVVIRASQAGNANYNAATDVDRTLTISAAVTAPTITTQPASQFVTVGHSVTFTVAASGSPTPTLQWKKNGVNISGANSSSYTIASVVTGDAGSYTVIATNSAGSATSNAAVLTLTTTAALVDFNGDGHPDLLWQNTVTGERSLWLMNGTSPASAVYLANVPTAWSIVAH